MARNSTQVGPGYPQVVVLVGATGDLSRRKLLPGPVPSLHVRLHPRLPHHRRLARRIDADGFRTIAREALDQFSARKVGEADWAAFAANLDYVPMSAGAGAL